MSVADMTPSQWAFVLDQMTPYATDDDWMWRLRVVKQMLKAQELAPQLAALTTSVGIPR